MKQWRFVSAALACVLAACTTPSNETTDDADLVGGQAEKGYAPAGYLRSNNARFGNSVRAQLCGATLVSPDTIVTAGHCVETGSAEYLVFGLGTYAEHAHEYQVRDIFRHPAYMVVPTADGVAQVPKHDIAVLRLTEKVTDVVPATIVAPQVGAGYRYVGYGQESAGNPNQNAMNANRKSSAFELTQVSELRAVARSDDAGNCWGDSGGPLFREKTNEIVGVASGFYEPPYECGPGVPMVYTNLATHRKFIADAQACPHGYYASNRLPPSCQTSMYDDEAMAGEARESWRITTGPHDSIVGVAVDAARGTVFAVNREARTLTALRPDGTVMWVVENTSPTSPLHVGRDGSVYAVTYVDDQWSVTALSPQGEKRWARPGAYFRASGDDHLLLMRGQGSEASELDASGNLVWSAKLQTRSIYDMVRGGARRYAFGEAYSRLPEQVFFVIDETGTPLPPIKLTYTVAHGTNLVWASDGTVYYASDSDGALLVALDANGKIKWTQRVAPTVDGGVPMQTPVIANGRIYVVGGRAATGVAQMTVVDTNGKSIWSLPWSAGAPPVFDGAGNVTAVTSRYAMSASPAGKELWRYIATEHSGEDFASVAAAPDGTVYLGRVRGLTALTPSRAR